MSEFAKNVLGFRKVHISSTEATSFSRFETSGDGDTKVALPTQFSFNMPSINTPPNTSCLGAIAVFTGGSINCSTGLDDDSNKIGVEDFMRISPVVNIEVAGWSNQNYYRPTKAGNTGMVATFDAETSIVDAFNMDVVSKNNKISTVIDNLTGNNIPIGTSTITDSGVSQGEYYSADGTDKVMTQNQQTEQIDQLDSGIPQTWADVSSSAGGNTKHDVVGVPQSVKLNPLTNTQSWRTGVCVGNPFSKQINCSIFLQQGYNANIKKDTSKNSAVYQKRDLVGLTQEFSDGAGFTTASYPVDSIASVDLYFDFLLYDMDRISGDKLQALLSL